MLRKVVVIMGSKSDLTGYLDSSFESILKSLGIEVETNIASAHRHSDLVQQICLNSFRDGVRVFVTIAGKAAHLSGAVAGHVGQAIVIGIPLESKPFGIQDAMLAMLSMPPGRVVLPVMDYGNAALAVAQIFSAAGEIPELHLSEHMLATGKKPELVLDTAAERETLRKKREEEAKKAKER